jgi:F-type H+-transporting ATPase subunit b
MRRQLLRLTGLGALAGALVLGSALPASAADEEIEELYEQLSEDQIVDLVDHHAHEIGASHATEECLPILIRGGEMEDCWEAPNPLLPETNEIIWGLVGFLIVFGALAKFGIPAMKKGMNARTERIRNDLKDAEDQRQDAEQLKAEYQASLNDAKAEAARIVDEARQAAEQLKRDRESELQTELAAQRERAVADIEASKAQATEDLKGDLAQLAIGAAETVVKRNLDAETQAQLVEEYIDQVAASRV